SSVALTRMLPVCTCALADAATPDASNTNRRRTHRFMLPPDRSPPTLSNRCIGFQFDLPAVVARVTACPETWIYTARYETLSQVDARVSSGRVDDHRDGDNDDVAPRGIGRRRFADDRAAGRHTSSIEPDVVARRPASGLPVGSRRRLEGVRRRCAGRGRAG